MVAGSGKDMHVVSSHDSSWFTKLIVNLVNSTFGQLVKRFVFKCLHLFDLGAHKTSRVVCIEFFLFLSDLWPTVCSNYGMLRLWITRKLHQEYVHTLHRNLTRYCVLVKAPHRRVLLVVMHHHEQLQRDSVRNAISAATTITFNE